MSTASGGGLKVGDLYVIVTASIGQALKSMGDLAKATEEMAKQVKEAAEPIGNLGAVVAAGIGAAVAAAATSNYELRMELKHLTDLLYTLAAEIGDLFGPTVKRLTAFIDKLVATFQRLSPRTKRAVADMAVWVAGMGLAIGTVGKLAGVVEGLSKSTGILIGVLGKLDKSVGLAGITAGVNKLSGSMRTALNGNKVAAVAAGAAAAKAGKEAAKAATDAAAATAGVGKEAAKAGKEVAKASKEAGEAAKRAGKDAASATGAIGPFLRSLGGLMLPLIALAAALAGIVLAAGALYGVWKTAGDGIKQSVASMLSSIGGFASKVWDTITTGVRAVVAGVEYVVRSSLSTLAWMIRRGARMMSPLVKALPKTLQMGRLNNALDAARNVTGDDLGDFVSTSAGKAKAAADATVGVAKAVASSMYANAAEVGTAVKDGVVFGLKDSWKNAKELGDQLGVPTLVEALSKWTASPLSTDKARVRMADDDERMVAAMGLDKVAAPVVEANEQLADTIRDLAKHGGTGARAYFAAVDAKARQLSAELVQAIEDARASIVSKVRASFGRINDLVNSFTEGFLAGGMNPLAGVGAVILDLLAQSEGFQVLMEMVGTVIQHVADALGAVLVPLQPLVGAIFLVIDAVVGALTPVFETLGQVLEPLVPPLVLVGAIFQTLAPVLTAVAQAVLMVMTPLQMLAGPVLKGLFDVLKVIAVVILTVAQGLSHVWNGIVGAIQAVIRGISKAVEWLGIDSLKNFANSMDRLKVDTDAMGESLQALNELTWESAEAKARETAEVLRNTDALQKATEALSNVPSAWKVALRRYQSQDAQDGPSSEPTRQPPPTPSGGGAHGPEGDWDGVRRNRWGEELPDWKQPNDPRREYTKSGAIADTRASITVNNYITGYDIDEALEEGARSVQRTLERVALRFGFRAA
ncbi:hypothetical protein [Corallococcus macrosporus]|uniref:Uncharacterized protein n=1 Tax=Myxococcus fulvus (strain ATCC BAA-855 / HW-1) TaxID=483219 RepID=F8CRL1_MYXFH|nr:hypothetical protein [Corallococcus macrosporus]AEI65556.1 hypothetical protein LILAB_18270 [Corallococcus macrosporus]